jgi:hypothetical protein
MAGAHGGPTAANAMAAADRRTEPDLLLALPIQGAVLKRGGAMSADPERSFRARLLQAWPGLVVGIGIAATIAWTALLAWLVLQVALSIL